MTVSRSLDICVLSKMFPPGVGGAETYAYALAEKLGEQGHMVDVYTQWVENQNEIVDLHENVTVYRITKARKMFVTFETLLFSYKASREIDFKQYDIVHGTLMPASTIALGPWGTGDSSPLILTSHGTSLSEARSVSLETPADYLLKFFFHPMNIVMDYIAGRGADKIIAISDHSRDELVQKYGFHEKQVDMIPHGVDTDEFYPRAIRHPTVNPDKMTVLYIGRLGTRKGLDLALQALARIDDPAIEFLIAGTGRYKKHLQTLATKLNVDSYVRFLGHIPDQELPILYSSADIFLLPSRYEGFGLVLLEAMACGTPVIGTNVGGIPTVIDQNQTGVIVPRDAERISNAIQLLTSDDEMRKNMGIRARSKAISMSWKKVVADVEEMYKAEIEKCC